MAAAGPPRASLLTWGPQHPDPRDSPPRRPGELPSCEPVDPGAFGATIDGGALKVWPLTPDTGSRQIECRTSFECEDPVALLTCLWARVRVAVLRCIPPAPDWSKKMTDERDSVDFAFVVALDQEFRVLHEYVGDWTPCFLDAYGIEDYQFEIEAEDGQIVSCVACYIDDMGPGNANNATHRVIEVWRPRIIINVGIAASLNPDDVRIGDVVVIKMAKDYVSKGKIAETETGAGVDFRPGGDYFTADPRLVAAVRHFEFANKVGHTEWREACSARLIRAVLPDMRDRMILEGNLRAQPLIEKTTLASGPVVGAAKAFKDWILGTDRNIKAMEMEAAGVLQAVASRPSASRALVVRGISDFADGMKSELDKVQGGVFRRLAMENSLDLLWRLIRSRRLDQGREWHATPLQRDVKSPGTRTLSSELEAIRASASNPDISVTQLSMLTLGYARRAGEHEIARWLDQEIEGYLEASVEKLPSYRLAGVMSKVNAQNIAQRVTDLPIPMQTLESNIRGREDLPDDIRNGLADLVAEQNTYQVRSGLAEVEDLAKEDGVRCPWPDQLVSFALPSVINLSPINAWQVVPSTVFRRVLQAVRKRIFDFAFPVGEIEGEDTSLASFPTSGPPAED